MTQTDPKQEHEGAQGATPEDSERQAGAAADRAPDPAAAPAPDELAAAGTAGAEDEREQALQAELQETKERLLRALAETENQRRRAEREIEDGRKYAISGFARELLEVADNLSRALASIPPKAREKIDLIKNLADGIEMTEKALLGIFERHRIVKVRPEIGEKFDHNRHQAMFEVETDRQPPGTIAQVLAPGYTIADRLLRPAMVGVAKAPAGSGGSEPAQGEDARNPPPANDSRPGERVDTTA